MNGRSSNMPITPDARQRLADQMDQRRQELDKLWQDIARDGGISLKALHTARTGGSEIRAATRRAIEKGLRWDRMSVDLVLDGGDPVPLTPPLAAVPDNADAATVYDLVDRMLTDKVERMIWHTPGLTLAEKAVHIDDYRAAKARAGAKIAEEDRDSGTALSMIT